jgi:3-methyladenine DNA glycosylase Tag
MARREFGDIYQQVLSRFTDVDTLEVQLPVAKTADELAALSDEYYLSEISRRVFRAGLKHSMVDAKWPAFEKAFGGFLPTHVAMMSDDKLDELMANRDIIRHWNKLKSVPRNAAMLLDIQRQAGSFADWLADWPVTDIVGLWAYLKKQGAQLGGNSGAYFLRRVGKDTFVLTADVVAALIGQGIVDKSPTAKRDLQLVQDAFNDWMKESGRPLCQISRLLAMTVNY